MNKKTFQEKELSILRNAVDNIEKKTGYTLINNPSIKTIIDIVEQFLKDKKRICYGGTAINNILPLEEQFYDKKVELPDYDFYSPTPLKDAKELADIYYKKGFEEVEAKAGMHPGTFKVFVNYIPVADITYLIDDIYKNIKKKSIVVDNIYYTPANYLRMSMYLELSRPQGDVSRWEKVLKRLSLLNKHYPLKGKQCDHEEIQRLFEYGVKQTVNINKSKSNSPDETINNLTKVESDIFTTTRDSLISQGCVFFGAYANRMVLKQHPSIKNVPIPRIPDFDVLSLEPKNTARIIKERLTDIGIKKIKIIKKKGVGEIIAPHYELKVGKETLVFIYEPLACHSYNIIKIANKNVRVATIDTMLSFYLSFAYVNRRYYKENRILCMSEYLFDVQQKNRLSQKGLLKRFTIDCYGEQSTMETMRAEKSDKYKELKKSKGKKEYEWYFLRYIPHELNQYKSNKTNKKKGKKTQKKKQRKNKTRKLKKGKKITLASLFK
tara:strand:+ start:299 stop:1780 length:1482 start_codon:yes stop_codon:yes gene_type:complete